MTISPDDTQPRSPFRVLPDVNLYEDDGAPNGPGCLVWGLVGLVILGVAVLIIALSGFAGWSSGQRIAQDNATTTQNAVINEQLGLIPVDVVSGNQTLLGKRIEYLAALTPAVPGLDSIIQTATAVYFNGLPIATALPTATPNAQPTVASTLLPLSTGSRLDLPTLLQQAQSDISLRDWDDAIDTLDIIMGTDANFETNTVRNLMLQALKAKALLLYRSASSSDLAEANTLTDRARQFGDVGDLDYESLIASEYLDAVNSIGVDYNVAIQRLTQVYNQAPAYKDVVNLLFSQYVSYGDALIAQGQICLAAVQYQNALNLVNDSAASAKLASAQTACANPTPLLTPPGEGTIAPVGVSA